MQRGRKGAVLGVEGVGYPRNATKDGAPSLLISVRCFTSPNNEWNSEYLAALQSQTPNP